MLLPCPQSESGEYRTHTPPILRFDSAFREEVRRRCSAFERVAPPADSQTLKHAAVAVVIVADGQHPAFLITRRAARLNSHGGQWALPGGRCDPGETAVDAARRELHEELGLAVPESDLLGVLDDYPTRSGYLITPAVFWADASHELHPNPQEVASVHRVRLDRITHPDAVDFQTIPESPRRVIRLNIGDDHIHAPTAALLYQFREVLAGRHTRVADLEQPKFAWK